MRRMRSICSSSFIIVRDSSSLTVENAAGSSSSTTFYAFVLTALAADASSSTSVVVLHLFKLVCTEIVRLRSAVDRFKLSIVSTNPIQEKSSDRLVYNEETAGWDCGHIMTSPSTLSSITSSWDDCGIFILKNCSGFGKRCKYQRKTTPLVMELLQLHAFLANGVKWVLWNNLAEVC